MPKKLSAQEKHDKQNNKKCENCDKPLDDKNRIVFLNPTIAFVMFDGEQVKPRLFCCSQKCVRELKEFYREMDKGESEE